MGAGIAVMTCMTGSAITLHLGTGFLKLSGTGCQSEDQRFNLQVRQLVLSQMLYL
jgi:hypothetical protein